MAEVLTQQEIEELLKNSVQVKQTKLDSDELEALINAALKNNQTGIVFEDKSTTYIEKPSKAFQIPFTFTPWVGSSNNSGVVFKKGTYIISDKPCKVGG